MPYSEFADLHEKLMQTHALPKDILPPKKIFGNQSPSFVKKRREELETYLKNILEFLQNVYPIELLEFLDFPNVETEGILASLAEQLYTQGDFLLEAHVPFKTSPLRLHAISERLHLACPPFGYQKKSQDFSHVLDYVSQVAHLHEIQVLRSQMKELWELILCDVVHQDPEPLETREVFQWLQVHTASFIGNDIESIDASVRLMPRLKYLDLSCNKITQLEHLTGMPFLEEMNLSYNCLTQLDDLHTKLVKTGAALHAAAISRKLKRPEAFPVIILRVRKAVLPLKL
ncbi:unnamed protein product [Darwinula stevensoni]|uniref:PX domain-containing protein n=1 Tax=Darwinula stevensoni TaxID=69355 RepID=A0A7R9AAU4_9CRUS|nr:unnamed protein product [Darwinula stevensoni]CAG0898662.1 unnamed protein product [Darwinula stevensoni]